ncbi:MAG: hypothetical protein M3046_11740 [Actinomycetota bacterium]|nr:hypothetical protein [Actinomycetota bacterium]
MTSFQSASSEQGRQFGEQCDSLLKHSGFDLLRTRVQLSDLGVEIDREARSPSGQIIWFEYKGSVQGSRPGLIRTDTMKKAIANGALLRAAQEHPPYVILASHLPKRGSGLAMLETARQLGYFHDLICIYDPSEAARLLQL